VYKVRPVLRDLAIWILLAPLFVLEARAFDQVRQTWALQDAGRVQHVLATVTAERAGARGPEVRYTFMLGDRRRSYVAMNTAGWGEAWVPISNEAWKRITQRAGQIDVMYLPEAPEANQPIGRVGYPLGDSAFGWAMFAIFDFIWLFETSQLARNYVRALVAAERRERLRIRFWRTLPVAPAHGLARHTKTQRVGKLGSGRY
jgi:hypothetical protein